MIISKLFIHDMLKEAKQEFNDKVYPLDNNIELEFIDVDKFLSDAKGNSIIKQQIALGLYKNFDKEYPNFFVVYKYNKDPMRRVLGLPYKVTVCYDIAKAKMKKYSPKEVRAYFKYAFIHELGHIYEDKIISECPDKWEDALSKTNGLEDLAKELLVDGLAEGLVDATSYDSINEHLWEPIKRRAYKKLL